ncbi:DUF4352 domain-containing protein [Nonomuraea phyllanthi]|uniref:DUF4352 domain-containing protein n=1 Tax=Nonomuraea phyllanthi TaxID=2219224 RepID=A0A5C4WKA8_9ACTN|nr:DUF4352 domain-containing protein [Nonomuraea phyllanthi]KAB8194446.1 DUF4352 domain-containing protein [Nonomuraea phyllanthi]
MGYPSQPQDPYGRQPPPHGYNAQPPQYGYQPPTGPPPPPRRNVTLIVLLAVGIPLLLLGGCSAIVLVLADAGRDAVVTGADSPNLVLPTREPASSAQPADEPTTQPSDGPSDGPSDEPSAEPTGNPPAEQSVAAIGGAITLEGMDPGLKMTVTVNRLVDPAQPASEYLKPKTGNKLVAVQVTLANAGRAVYSDSPTNGAWLIDREGQQYRSTVFDVREGPSFGGSATVNTGDTRKGMIVFEVPESMRPAKFQFGLNSGFADQKGEWSLR